jgi:putative transposase
MLGDKAYDSAELRDELHERGTKPVIPNRSNRKQPFSFSKRLYKLRWRIESAFNRLKDFRRIATRYDRPARNYLASVSTPEQQLDRLKAKSPIPLMGIPRYAGWPGSGVVDLPVAHYTPSLLVVPAKRKRSQDRLEEDEKHMEVLFSLGQCAPPVEVGGE